MERATSDRSKESTIRSDLKVLKRKKSRLESRLDGLNSISDPHRQQHELNGINLGIMQLESSLAEIERHRSGS